MSECLDFIDVVKRLLSALIDITEWLSWSLMSIAMVFLGIGLDVFVGLSGFCQQELWALWEWFNLWSNFANDLRNIYGSQNNLWSIFRYFWWVGKWNLSMWHVRKIVPQQHYNYLMWRGCQLTQLVKSLMVV